MVNDEPKAHPCVAFQVTWAGDGLMDLSVWSDGLVAEPHLESFY